MGPDAARDGRRHVQARRVQGQAAPEGPRAAGSGGGASAQGAFRAGHLGCEPPPPVRHLSRRAAALRGADHGAFLRLDGHPDPGPGAGADAEAQGQEHRVQGRDQGWQGDPQGRPAHLKAREIPSLPLRSARDLKSFRRSCVVAGVADRPIGTHPSAPAGGGGWRDGENRLARDRGHVRRLCSRRARAATVRGDGALRTDPPAARSPRGGSPTRATRRP